MVGRSFAVDRYAPLSRLPQNPDRSGCAHMLANDPGARHFGQKHIPGHDHLLRNSRPSRQSKNPGPLPLIHYTAGRKRLVFTVVQDRQIKHPGIFQGSPHQLRTLDAVTVIRNRHNPRLPQGSDRRQLLPFLPDRNRPRWKNIRHPRFLCPLFHPGDGVRSVRHRGGVRHRDHRGKPAGHRRSRPRGNRLLRRLPRLPQMHVRINQTRGDDASLHLNHDRIFRDLSFRNLAVPDQ